MISVVCVYNNESILRSVLQKSLENQTARFELILLDNSGKKFRSAAEALNCGGARARSDYLMFAHQDMWLASSTWLEDVERVLNGLPILGVAGVAGVTAKSRKTPARVVSSIGFFDEATAVDSGYVQAPEEVQTVDECLLLVPRPVFDKLKFDETTFDGWDCYGADYCLCAKGLGLKVYVVPAPCNHCCSRAILPRWGFKDLLKYQRRLYSKHRHTYKTIYTWMGPVSRLHLRTWWLKGLLGPLHQRLLPSLLAFVGRELAGCETVLDVGCGYRSLIQLFQFRYSVGVEVFEPFLQESKREAIHTDYILADIRSVAFKPKSFDAVVAVEVLEHLTKEEGTMLLRKMEQWARKRVIVTTPSGYSKQDCYESNPLQEHRSGWEAGELVQLGFRVRGSAGWKKLRGGKFELKYRPAFLWKRIADLTQVVVYLYPKLAYQLMAVKRVDSIGQSRTKS